MAANATFHFDNGDPAGKEQIFLPATAVGEDTQGNFVYVIEKNSESRGVAKRRMVTLGELTTKGFKVKPESMRVKSWPHPVCKCLRKI